MLEKCWRVRNIKRLIGRGAEPGEPSRARSWSGDSDPAPGRRQAPPASGQSAGCAEKARLQMGDDSGAGGRGWTRQPRYKGQAAPPEDLLYDGQIRNARPRAGPGCHGKDAIVGGDRRYW